MSIEYLGLSEINGPLVILEGVKGAAFDEIVSFKIRVPLYNGKTLTDSFGWIFRIEKTAQL